MKICNVCNQSLELSAFALQSTGKLGVRATCKKCVKTKYLHTTEGLIRKMYTAQRAKSKKRSHPAPNYTLTQLYEWCVKQPIFELLYQAWVNSGYETLKIPTCDRLDDYLPYSLDNLQLLTFEENSKKYYKDAVEGRNTKTCTPVVCYDLQGNYIAEYHSLKSAARAFNTSHANIRNICLGKPILKTNPDGSTRTYVPKQLKGFTWKFKEV